MGVKIKEKKEPRRVKLISKSKFFQIYFSWHVLFAKNTRRQEYANRIKELIQQAPKGQKTWAFLKSKMRESAEKVVGIQKRDKNIKPSEYDEQIERLSCQQKLIKLQINNNAVNAEEIKELKNTRNKIMRSIKNKLKAIREKNIDNIINEINEAGSAVKFFKAVKKLRQPQKTSSSNVTIHDENGKNIVNENEKYSAVKEHFRKQFYNENEIEVEPFQGEARPLNQKITKDEVSRAAMKMSNNKAAGEDGIANEMIKYGPEELHQEIANILNEIFETHRNELNTGESVLLPIPKPNKQKGPLKNLRPINLLNTIRKLLSNITLGRIQEKVDTYISPSQSAYRRGRSTSDAVWTHRFIAAKAQLYKDLQVNIIGIDMSSAFDTIQRKPLMNVLETILNEDEQRMSRILLSKTSISIKFGKHRRENVKTNIGSPQGDGISGIFFNIALENALRTLRVDLNEKNQVERSSLPTEIIYADDSDFLSEDNSRSEVLKEIVKDCLGRFNLKVNEEKTEETAIKREQGKAEKWRWTKKLGNLLGDYQDMKRREQLSIIAQASAKKLWMNKKVNIQTKLKIYKSIVKPVLTYNFAILALTKSESKELDCIHRKQLRQVWNDKRIHNKQLYEKSREKPLSAEMKEARWRTFGHILRLPTSTPCQQSMNYYFECPPKAKKFRGRKRITLPVLLDNDIVEAAKYHQRLQIRQFKTRKDLDILRHLADDRNGWKNLTNLICSVVQGEQ